MKVDKKIINDWQAAISVDDYLKKYGITKQLGLLEMLYTFKSYVMKK